MVMCLGQGADLHMVQHMPLLLTMPCSSKSRLVLPFWCQFTRVIPDKRLCVCVRACTRACMRASVKSAFTVPAYQGCPRKMPLNGSVYKQMIDNNYVSIICLREFSLILLYFFCKFFKMAEWKIYSFSVIDNEVLVLEMSLLYLLTVTDQPLRCENLALVLMSHNWRIPLFLQT